MRVSRCWSADCLRNSFPFILILALCSPIEAAPVIFVTQTPYGEDFLMIAEPIGNHLGGAQSAVRGGDLYIRYDDGSLRNLTAELGFGTQAGAEIAVRDPSIHWDAEKALFSMVIGGTTQDVEEDVYFEIYELTGFGLGESASARKIPQPENYNNVSPIYGADDRIIFTSDRPRDGDRRLYPQLDEYESAPTTTGIWSMEPDGSDLVLLDHAPSGDFSPLVDSFGRIIFTRWDHLERDQQAEQDIADIVGGGNSTYDTITFDSEQSDAFHAIAPGDEVFPEPGEIVNDPTWNDLGPDELTHTFNHFFPWMMNPDGTELETLNHVGRHELHDYIQESRTYLPDAYSEAPRLLNFFFPREDPMRAGYFYGINAPEFFTHSAGQIVGLMGSPATNPDDMLVDHVTNPETADFLPEGQTPTADHIGLFRDPMPRVDGTLWAVHSLSPFHDRPEGNGSDDPYRLNSRYDFAIKRLVESGDYFIPGDRLVPGGISDSVSYFDNNRYATVVYDGAMWELQPVEVASRPRPPMPETPLPQIERDILLAELGGQAGLTSFRSYLRENDLALVISRDITQRADRQQDFNLEIESSGHKTAEPDAETKKITYMQFFEGLQVRGYGQAPTVDGGRRILAQPMREDLNPELTGAPGGSVLIGDDGSMAAILPARRAMTWQSTDSAGEPIVRERYWLTFQPGEIRSCANCHGLNRNDVFGDPGPTNPPQALIEMARAYRATLPNAAAAWEVYE